MLTVAIVGRPNVGKSTLFNRLIGRRLALVDDSPGVTRDIREGRMRRGDLDLTLLDTAGMSGPTAKRLEAGMRVLAERAIDSADACLFMVDARDGLTVLDVELAELLRKRDRALLLLTNKAEGRIGHIAWQEFYSLGLGEPLAISAEHGEGLDDLYAWLQRWADSHTAETRNDDSQRVNELESGLGPQPEPETDPEPKPAALAAGSEHGADPLRIAVVGRPNAGKSTLVNQILGRERLLTGPEAGITRDAISVGLEWKGTPIRIWDTAGLRKKAKVAGKLEKLSVGDALRAVRFSEVVVVLLDAGCPFESQDLKIADLAAREGRAVVVAINKWDRVDDRRTTLASLGETFVRLLPQLRGAPMVTVSATKGTGINRLHAAIRSAHDVWNRRIPTGELNRWLERATALHPPPAPGGRRLKLRYVTQVKTRPPGFVVMCSRSGQLGDDYRRYLINSLRETFELPGTPIRLTVRSRPERNPYRPG
ncbi:MAG: ribosome biogenesis GTPase Der [Paracoccaceae bacterium]|nr:ribosome biogenesis GTPase Der [Paracoccaceae bacterium]